MVLFFQLGRLFSSTIHKPKGHRNEFQNIKTSIAHCSFIVHQNFHVNLARIASPYHHHHSTQIPSFFSADFFAFIDFLFHPLCSLRIYILLRPGDATALSFAFHSVHVVILFAFFFSYKNTVRPGILENSQGNIKRAIVERMMVLGRISMVKKREPKISFSILHNGLV